MAGWPTNYRDRLSGAACELCAEGRPEETVDRVRFFSSDLTDAYLHRRGVQRGFAAVIWRGEHAVEPTDLVRDEAVALWRDVLLVAEAMHRHFRPLKMNYSLLGNGSPHLHWLLAPRFLDDAAPGGPLPTTGYVSFPEAQLREDVLALKAILAKETTA